MEMRNEVMETCGGKGLRWQGAWLPGVLAPELNGKTELKNNELQRKGQTEVQGDIIWTVCDFL